MKYIKLMSIFSILILLTNCSTPYQPKGSIGGYSEEKIITNMYKVEFEGNQHTKPDLIQNYLLYRCAELTQEMGFNYFTIINEERHFDKYSVRPTRGVSFQTRTSMSGGTNTTVSPDLQNPTNSTKYTGAFVIKFLSSVDEQYINAVFKVDDVLEELADIVKK